MVINVSVQYNGGLLPDVILLILCYYIVVLVVFTLKTVLTSIQHLLFLTLQGK